MALSISKAVERIKSDLFSILPADIIMALCRQLNYRWRDRCLNPVTTIQAFLLQILHGNVACDHVSHLMGRRFTGEAYCQARSRLPLELFQRLLTTVCTALASCTDSARWLGHRVWLIDGSSCSTSDTKSLQKAFGQPGNQRKGCGFPVVHLLALFDCGTGLLLRISAAPLRTHDLSLIAAMHAEMTRGDVLVGDRGFCSYGHFGLLFQAGIHGLFRLHQATIVSFHKRRRHAGNQPKGSRKKSKGLPKSRWIQSLGKLDQIVEYFKPKSCPAWLSYEEYARLPDTLRLRELRYRVQKPGFRTRDVTLVTTLLDPHKYSKEELAALYAKRWQVETHLKHLKQTLGMDTLRTKSPDNILKELCMYVLVYNLVRLVMLDASRRQQVPMSRISFIDALRSLRHALPGSQPRPLNTIPARPGRFEPRVRKRRPKQFSVMIRARSWYRKRKTSTCSAQS